MKTLQASSKHYLTNADNSIMGKTIYLPDTADESEFTEITESAFKKAKEAYEAKVQAEIEAKMNPKQEQESDENESEQELDENESEQDQLESENQ